MWSDTEFAGIDARKIIFRFPEEEGKNQVRRFRVNDFSQPV